MKHVALAVALLVAFAAPALATHNRPSSAKQIQTMLTTAYDECTIANAVHQPSLGAPACNPEKLSSAANPVNVTTFAPSNIATMKVTAKVINGDIKITVIGKLIHNNGTVYSGQLKLALLLRITDHACLPAPSNPCTMVDFPLAALVTCGAGQCATTTTINTLLPGAIVAGKEMNVEFAQIVVQDPDGDDAFRQGLFVP